VHTISTEFVQTFKPGTSSTGVDGGMGRTFVMFGEKMMEVKKVFQER